MFAFAQKRTFDDAFAACWHLLDLACAMLTDRQHEIMRIATAEGAVGVEGLAERFDVTPQTIRRDLNVMCDRGLLARNHGGARPIDSVSNTGYADRAITHSVEKRLIGQAAAALIPPRSSISLNIGTTTEQVAWAICGTPELMVITNNINVINILAGAPDKELLLAGGSVRQSDGAVIGDSAADFFGQFRVDLAVIGASAVETDGTILDFDHREVRVAHAIITNSRKVMLVVDHSKFERRATVRICDLARIDMVVTNQPPPAPFAARCAAEGVEIIVAADKITNAGIDHIDTTSTANPSASPSEPYHGYR